MTAIKIRTPDDVVPLVQKYANARQENFLVITLDGTHEVIKVHHLTKGLVNKTMIHPREAFYHAIKENATSVIFIHNHPSGHVEPSEEDRDITSRLNMASVLMGFNMLDHLIIAKSGRYYSFLGNGDIKNKFSMSQLRDYVTSLPEAC